MTLLHLWFIALTTYLVLRTSGDLLSFLAFLRAFRVGFFVCLSKSKLESSRGSGVLIAFFVVVAFCTCHFCLFMEIICPPRLSDIVLCKAIERIRKFMCTPKVKSETNKGKPINQSKTMERGATSQLHEDTVAKVSETSSPER